MKWMGLNELREKYLSFFESKGHLRLPSFSLVPQDDKSLLLINSGMAPMKKCFTGEVAPPRKRVTTCQKCIRTPDIERVGMTARHGTFFEMLGNFSFGDYFKRESTLWAWEFCVDVLKLPVEKIFVSIYQDDDEAFDVWTKHVGVDPCKIVRLGKQDNFWEHGAGPCGPCSELYFDRGEKYGCGSPDCKVGCDCDRYVEFWNLVFTQFENDGNNNYTRLEHPNIDTGMGLERLACIIQGVDNLFLVDTVQNIMSCICKIANVKYGEDSKKDVSLRVITDHVRGITFMISDGIMPSNEGRGYVLRRLLRRASRHGKLLDIHDPFLHKVCRTVIEENKNAYPMLEEKQDFIKEVVLAEETSFNRTIDQGLQILNTMIQSNKSKVLSGDDAFKLSDTYGFPIDLTKEIVAEKDMTVNEKRFNDLMSKQKTLARNARTNKDLVAWKNYSVDFGEMQKTNFVGYNQLSVESKVEAIIVDGKLVESFDDGEATVVLNTSPFYAESGGQVGDTGKLVSSDAEVCVVNTTKNESGIFLHKSIIKKGHVNIGDTLMCFVDSHRRSLIMRNHTAAHLLQAALRKVVGNHVEQAGQLVNEKQVRFDFTHFSPLSTEQIRDVEKLVNLKIFEAINVQSREMAIDEAKKIGAMALFGEKYGDVVRVINVEDFSVELCGGTHVSNTSVLGLFKIVSESSVASGVRRIEAVTSEGALSLFDTYQDCINNCSEELKLNNKNDLLCSVKQVVKDVKDKDKSIRHLTSVIANMKVENLVKSAKTFNNVNLVVSKLKDTDAGMLKTLCDKIKEESKNTVVILAGLNNGKASLAVAVGKDVAKHVHAGDLARTISKLTGGNGGGKPDFAMAGIKDVSKLDSALLQAEKIFQEME